MIKGYKNPIITDFKLTKAQYESTIIHKSSKQLHPNQRMY